MSINSTACAQRTYNLSKNIPPTRFSLWSPYANGYTKEQVDMRRKAEILKYNKNSTQCPQLSKKAKNALISRGNYKGNQLFCSNDKIIYTPTSSSDVPGPIINLYEDKSIPLYNYETNINPYAITQSTNTDEWTFFINEDIYIPSGLSNITNISTILIREHITHNKTTFTYSFPVVINISGTSISSNADNLIINTSINNLITKIFYSSYEVSNEYISINIDIADIQIVLNSPNSTGDFNFDASIYIGYITVSNLILSTLPGFSYNLGISYNATETLDTTNISNNIDSTDIINNIQVSMIGNINENYDTGSSSNCTITTNASNKTKKIEFIGTQ